MEDKRPELKVLIGIPGSGKSHWIWKNKLHLSHFIVSPDNIRRDMFGDITDQSNNVKVFDIALGMVIAALKLNKNVILDATNCNTQYRREFLKDMPYCKMSAYLFDIQPQIASDRISKDIRNNKLRSNVPESVVYRMYGEYLFTKNVIKKEFSNSQIKIITEIDEPKIEE